MECVWLLALSLLPLLFTHWVPPRCSIVVSGSGCRSSGRACLPSCSAVMDFLQFARSCLTFCRIITQIASGVCFAWNVWIKTTGPGGAGESRLCCSGAEFGVNFPNRGILRLRARPPSCCSGLLGTWFTLKIKDLAGGKGRRRLNKTN